MLLVTSPKLPDLPFIDADTSLGKRTTQLDLNSEADHKTLASLARDADVFLQAYRPGGLEQKGFGVDDVIRLREGKGVVYASLRAYGWEGPWKDRRGVCSRHPPTHTYVSLNVTLVRFLGANCHGFQSR